MTRDADFKRLVRTRMRASGEPYTAARAALRPGKEARMIPVTVQVRIDTSSLEPPEAETPEEQLVATFATIMPRGKPLLLLTAEDEGELPIYCGPVEATSVAFALQGIVTPRPMTHDLLRDVVAAMGTAREVRITEMQDTTYFAELIVTDSTGEERTVSCRPSDGIAFAVRAGIPILVNEDLFPDGTVAAAEA